MIGHNGYYVCPKCELPGRQCGCGNHTVHSWNDYIIGNPQKRTQAGINEQSLTSELRKFIKKEKE